MARANVRAMLRNRRPARGGQKWLAHEANIGYNTLNHWLGGHQDMGAQTLSAIAKVFGVSVEHLFYNTPDEPETAQPQGEGDWQGAIREVERYVRSITDPERRDAVALRLRAVALGEVEAFERDLDRRASPGGHPGGAPGKSKQGGGRAQGAA